MLSGHALKKFCLREGDGFALDVSFWKYSEGNHVNWVAGSCEAKTKLHGGGRDFIPSSHMGEGQPYMLISGGNENFVLGCDMDSEKAFEVLEKAYV